VPKIRLDSKTGLPFVRQYSPGSLHTQNHLTIEVSEEGVHDFARATVSRPRDESKDAKKAKKHAVKVERQARRIDKKLTKEQFSTEAQRQIKSVLTKENARMRKL